MTTGSATRKPHLVSGELHFCNWIAFFKLRFPLRYIIRPRSQLQKSEIVIPAEAEIQSFQEFLDPRLRGGDTVY